MQNTPLRIGLSYTGTDEKHSDYANWIAGKEAIEVIKLDASLDNADLVATLDALVISGGVDIHPSHYGSKLVNYPNAPAQFNEPRDAFETKLFQLSQQYIKPVLGICRGMQLINVILGGDLTQDLGDDGNASHRNVGVDKAHPVSIVEGSLLQQIIGDTAAIVNSAHHQCLHRVAGALVVAATAADGIIEAVEWKEPANKPFMLCVQWHPERMYKIGLQQLPTSIKIREYFIQQVRHSKQEVVHS